MLKYTTKIEITVFHENENDTVGLDDVLMNVVRKWDYPITPAVYQLSPGPIPEWATDMIRSLFPDIRSKL